jgi:hypothetical protein
MGVFADNLTRREKANKANKQQQQEAPTKPKSAMKSTLTPNANRKEVAFDNIPDDHASQSDSGKARAVDDDAPPEQAVPQEESVSASTETSDDAALEQAVLQRKSLYAREGRESDATAFASLHSSGRWTSLLHAVLLGEPDAVNTAKFETYYNCLWFSLPTVTSRQGRPSRPWASLTTKHDRALPPHPPAACKDHTHSLEHQL